MTSIPIFNYEEFGHMKDNTQYGTRNVTGRPRESAVANFVHFFFKGETGRFLLLVD